MGSLFNSFLLSQKHHSSDKDQKMFLVLDLSCLLLSDPSRLLTSHKPTQNKK